MADQPTPTETTPQGTASPPTYTYSAWKADQRKPDGGERGEKQSSAVDEPAGATPTEPDSEPDSEQEPTREEHEEEEEKKPEEDKQATPRKRTPIEDAKHYRKRAQMAERERDELRQRLEAEQSAKSKPAEAEPLKPKTKAGPMPKLSDPGIDFDDRKFAEAMEGWLERRLEERESIRAEQQAKEAQKTTMEQEAREVTDAYQKRAQAYIAANKMDPGDYETIMRDIERQSSQAMIDVVLRAENGPELAMYLAANPGELERLAHLTPRLVGYELGKIESRFHNGKTPDNGKPGRSFKPVATVTGQTVPPEAPTDKALRDGNYMAFKHAANQEEWRRRTRR